MKSAIFIALLFALKLSPQGMPMLANGMVHAQGAASFLHYRVITIDHTKVPNTDQTNFPVMFRSPVGTVNTVATAVTLATGDQFPTWMDAIDIAGTTYAFTRTNGTTGTTGSSAGTQTGAAYNGTPYLKTIANGGLLADSTNGYDAGWYTSSACSTKLDWERVTWSATTGVSEWHFRESTLATASDTVAYLCYDNSGITTNQSNPTGVWNTNYKAIYHVKDGTTLSGVDSTSSGFNLTNSGATATAGQIDGAANFVAASSQYMVNANPAVTGFPLTIEGWFKASDLSLSNGDARIIASVAQTAGLDEFWVDVYDDMGTIGMRVLAQHSGASFYNQYGPTLDTNFHRIMAVFTNSTTFSLNFDGVLLTPTKTVGGAITPTGLTDTYLGAIFYNTSNYYAGWNGKLDDIRFSNSARGDDWAATSFNNQNAFGTFMAVGAQN